MREEEGDTIRGKFPGDIVVRFDGVFRILLRSEEIHGVIAIGLIETYDVGANGEGAFFKMERLFRAADFDVLAHQASDELRDARGISLIVRNKEGRRRFIEAFAIGVQVFFVEIVEERARVCGGVVEDGECGGFVVVKIVAGGPGDFSH